MADIKDKIRKLLALADGQANEKESARALELAHKLMMEHGIEQDSLGSAHRPSVGLSNRSRYNQEWEADLAAAAAHLYGVRCVSNRSHKEFWFVGRPDNMEMAQHTTAYLILQVESYYKQRLPKGLSQKDRARFRKEFKLVATNRVAHRVVEFVSSGASTGSTALVLHKDQLKNEIDDFLSHEGIRYSKQKRRAKTIKSAEALAAGTVAGNALDLHKVTR